jgi:hypothetical protein
MRIETKLLRSAVADMVGNAEDNAYRARAAFKKYTPAQMQEQHGASGRKRRDILDDYEEHLFYCKNAQALLNQLLEENQP